MDASALTLPLRQFTIGLSNSIRGRRIIPWHHGFNMPMTTSVLLSKAISLGLSESERALVSPPLLAQLAIGRHITLTPSDRRRMPKTTLALLAIGGFIELTRYERDSFSPHTLVMLALNGRAELQDNELARLSADLQVVVKNKAIKKK
jgi:hypothetical protein